MKYNIIESFDPMDLVARVNDLLACGWQPHGGLSVTVIPGAAGDGGHHVLYAQAVVLPAD